MRFAGELRRRAPMAYEVLSALKDGEPVKFGWALVATDQVEALGDHKLFAWFVEEFKRLSGPPVATNGPNFGRHWRDYATEAARDLTRASTCPFYARTRERGRGIERRPRRSRAGSRASRDGPSSSSDDDPHDVGRPRGRRGVVLRRARP